MQREVVASNSTTAECNYLKTTTVSNVRSVKNQHVHIMSFQQPVTVRNTVEKSTVTCFNKKLSYCTETARFFVSLNTSLSHSRSLKIIQNDTLEQGMCKSLLVFHCNYVCTLYRFWDIQRHIMAWPWNLGWESFKVIENGTIRKLGYGFLFAFHSNCDRIFSRFNTIHERVTDRHPSTSLSLSLSLSLVGLPPPRVGDSSWPFPCLLPPLLSVHWHLL